jgi:type I restriction enzyme M protein
LDVANGKREAQWMETHTFETWTDLAQLVEIYFDKNWIFRGVANKDFKLIPTVGRRGARKDSETGKNLSYDVKEGSKSLNQFIREARTHLPYEPRTSLEWLAIAQHHGMPTRLLDWTASPLVAAFFAVKGGGFVDGERKDAAIYGASMPPVATVEDERYPFEMADGVPKLYRPPHLSPRIIVQQGVFTLHPNPEKEYDSLELKKWIIPTQGADNKRAGCFPFKRMLDTCGINQSSLFPDIDGLAGHLGWCYRWGRLA